MSTEGAELWRQNHDANKNAERDAQLQVALQNAPTPEEQQAVIHDAYAKDPNHVKDFVENLGRRLVGKQPVQTPSPYATPTTTTQVGGITDPDTGQAITPAQSVTVQGPAPKTRAQAFAGHAARGVLPAQQKANFDRAQVGPDTQAKIGSNEALWAAFQNATKDMSPDQQRQVASVWGIKEPTAPYKTYVGPDGTRQSFPSGSQPEGWQIAPTGAPRLVQVTGADGKPRWATSQGGGQFLDPNTGEVIPDAKPYQKPAALQPKAGMSNGKNVYATLTDKGWIDTNTQQPLHDFRPMPTFAETGLWGVDPVQNADGTVGSAMVNRRTGQSKVITGPGGTPIAPSLMAQVTKSIEPAIESETRLGVMRQNAKDAFGLDGRANQQAMLSLVANHIGMTLGAQKGARINQAVWNEAVGSAPWLANVEKKWDADGYLQGVTLSPEQVKQMLALGKQRRDLQWQQVQQAGKLYGVNVPTPDDVGGGGESPKGPAPKAGGRANRIRVKLSDGRTGTIDASDFDAKTMTKVQ